MRTGAHSVRILLGAFLARGAGAHCSEMLRARFVARVAGIWRAGAGRATMSATNRIAAAVSKTSDLINARIRSGAITADRLAAFHSELDLSFEEHFRFQ